MLLQPGEEFTSQKVIDLALKQDIGPDPALSRKKKHYLYEHEIDADTKLGFSKDKIRDRAIFRSDNYFAEYQNKASTEDELPGIISEIE